MKRVVFQETPVEIIPTPVVEVSDDEEGDKPLTQEEREEKRAVIEAEDGHPRMSGRRSKRRREWIWRPMPEDVMDRNESVQGSTIASAEQVV